jgi:hypothetical protein
VWFFNETPLVELAKLRWQEGIVIKIGNTQLNHYGQEYITFTPGEYTLEVSYLVSSTSTNWERDFSSPGDFNKVMKTQTVTGAPVTMKVNLLSGKTYEIIPAMISEDKISYMIKER